MKRARLLYFLLVIVLVLQVMPAPDILLVSAQTQEEGESTFIREIDQRMLGYHKKLEYLQAKARKVGDIARAKQIDQLAKELLVKNSTLHKLPKKWKKDMKEKKNKKEFEKQLHRYYKSKEQDFKKLAKRYQQVLAQLDENGEISFPLQHVATTQASITMTDPWEPNDTTADAKLLQVGSQIQAQIGWAGDLDGYKIISTQTKMINVRVTVPADKDYDLTISTDADFIGSSMNGTGMAERIDFQAVAGTVYYMGVSGQGSTDYGDVPYTLTVGSGDLSENTPVDVSLPSGVSQVLRFTPAQTGAYQFYTGAYGGMGGLADTVLELYADHELTQLISSNDDDENHTVFSRIKTNLNAGVSYYLNVMPYAGSLHTRVVVVQDMSQSAPALALDTPVDIGVEAGQSQVFAFTPPRSGLFTIATGPHGGDGAPNDTKLEMYENEYLGTLISYNDDANGSLFSVVNVSREQGSTFYVKISNANPSEGVQARLVVTSGQDTTTPTPPPPTPKIGQPIDVDVPAGSAQVYPFTPTKTGVHRIYTGPYGGTAGENDTVLELYADAGLTDLLAENDDAHGTTFSEIKTTLSQGVTYSIKLSHYDSDKAVHTRLAVSFDDQTPAISIAYPVVAEAGTNDGRMASGQVIHLVNATFATDMSNGVTVNNLPPGLSILVTRNSDQQITITFQGKATRHTNAQDITDASVTILRDKFIPTTSLPAPDLTTENFQFDFRDAGLQVVLDNKVIPEVDGSGWVKGSQTVTLLGGTFKQLGVSISSISVSNLPFGISMYVYYISETQFRIDYNGRATYHADANDVKNATITIQPAALNNYSGPALVTEPFLIDFFDKYSTSAHGYVTNFYNQLMYYGFRGSLADIGGWKIDLTYDANGNLLTKKKP